MTTPENYGSQPWQDPAAPPTAPMPPASPPPAPSQYGPPPAQEPLYPPAAPQYPPAPESPPAPQYPPTAPQYAPPQYPPGQYPPGPYPPPQPPAKKRGGLFAAIGGIVLVLLIGCGVVVLKIALRGGVEALVNNDTSTTDTTTPANPFEGTPTAVFPQGEAGIVLPPATEVPGFTEEQVATALADVKKAMVAGRVDSKMLVGHDTTAFVKLFSPTMQTDLADYFAKKDFMSFATQIAPSHKLTSDPVRMNGDITFRGTTIQGDLRVIEVTTNFVWVYAFTGALDEPGDHLVSIHDEIQWLFPHPEDVIDEAIGMNLGKWESFASNIDCALFEGSLIALGKPRLVVGGGNQDPNDPFDPNGTLDITDTC